MIACIIKMVEVETRDGEEEETGRELHRAVSLPALPRTGELLDVKGNFHKVQNIEHYPFENPQRVCVEIYSDVTFERLSHDSNWTRVNWK